MLASMKLLVLVLALAAIGCVRVHAYQRENLAKRAMTDDVEAGEGKALGGAPQAEQLEAGDRGAGNRPTKTYQG